MHQESDWFGSKNGNKDTSKTERRSHTQRSGIDDELIMNGLSQHVDDDNLWGKGALMLWKKKHYFVTVDDNCDDEQDGLDPMNIMMSDDKL